MDKVKTCLKNIYINLSGYTLGVARAGGLGSL